jgi:hypothetical protein
MSDVSQDWQEAPMQRKGPPKWMIFTGCGCLLPGFLLVGLLAWGMQFFGTATSPLAAYESLAQTLPYDEALKGRSTGLADDPSTRALESHEAPEYVLSFGTEIPFSGGVAIYHFVRGARVVDDEAAFDDEGVVVMITKVPSDQADVVMESSDGDEPGEPFQIEVQGVTLSGMRHTSLTSDFVVQFPSAKAEVSGPGVTLKLLSQVAQNPDDEESKLFAVVLVMLRAREDGAQITDEELQHFLAPFHIGPAR